MNKRPTWREAGGFETILEIRIRRPCLVYDIRRLNLDSINSMDLFRLADQLRAAYQSERHVPGKTAIVYREDGPPIYSSSQRLFHNFSIWAKEHQLPRDFALFSAMADAVVWLGSKKNSDAQATHLIFEDHPNECEQASCAHRWAKNTSRADSHDECVVPVV